MNFLIYKTASAR